MHICSTTAIFPQFKKVGGKWKDVDTNGGWFFKHNENYYPNSLQKKIWKHYDNSLNLEASSRKNKELILILNGDLFDGVHHGTHQLTSQIISEQVEATISFLEYTKERLGFTKQDKIYVISGTESHTGDEEERIAERIKAEHYAINRQVADFLELYIEDFLMWIYHHGVSSGSTPNRGVALYNQLKRIYYECLEENRQYPNLVVTAHTHDAEHRRFESKYRYIDGVILPSLQSKTRYVNGKMPIAVNKIGIHGMNYENGRVAIEEPFLLTQPLGEVVRIK